MSGVLLVPDLALERWPSMDRYAAELASRLPGVEVPEEARTLGGPRYLARYVRYPRALRRYRPALVHVADHSYAHCLAAFPGTPGVVTVHDVHLHHVVGEHGTGPRAAVRDALLRRTAAWLRRAAWWIAGTRFVADEAVRVAGLPADRITVVPYGVADRFFAAPPPEAVRELRARWARALGRAGDAGTRFVLHVGSCAPRKNLPAALAALVLLRQRGLDAVLVQLGGAFDGEAGAAASRPALAGHVLQPGHVAEGDLHAAYTAADVLVIPSRYEGFGFPVVEAMAAGLPVVASDIPGLAEARGDAALAAPADDPAALAAALAAALTDPARRTAMIAQGRAHAARFRWDAAAAATREVYRRAVEA